MQNTIYFLSAVASVCAMYFIWSLGIRRLLLDEMREKIFTVRFELFRLGMNKEIDFDDEAYRALETLFCGLIRYAHRITFLTWLISTTTQALDRKEKDYVDVSAQIGLKVSRLEPKTQEKILAILQKAKSALFLYIGLSSLLFLTVALIYKILDITGIRKLEETKEKVTVPIVREAYLAEARHGIRLATA